MDELIYVIIGLFLFIILTFTFSPIIHSAINNDIASSNHYNEFNLYAEVLSVLSIVLDLHGLLLIIAEIIATLSLIYRSI